MLEVFDADCTKADIVDIEAEFSKILITVDDNIRKIIKAVDKGELLDTNKFKDRFGVVLYVSELSTGCKAAICTYFNPNSIVDTQECGLNARDAIFNYCEDGKILLHDFSVTVNDNNTRKSPIMYAGRKFTLDEFNDEVM
jgi:hypothetical protein